MRNSVLLAFVCVAIPVCALAQSGMQNDQVPRNFTLSSNPRTLHAGSNAAGGGKLGNRSNSSLLGIDSIPNWSSYFYYPGVDGNGNLQFTWDYTMVGHAPFGQGNEPDWEGETTKIHAPIVPVSVDLRNFDGTPRFVNGQRLYYDATQYVKPVLHSPVFQTYQYDSSHRPTQFTDAVQRAELLRRRRRLAHLLVQPRYCTSQRHDPDSRYLPLRAQSRRPAVPYVLDR